MTAAAAALVIVGTAAPAGAGSETPQQVLARVQKFLKKATSVKFTAVLQAGGTQVGTLEQDAVFPDRGRSLRTMGGTPVSEVLFIGNRVFVRQAAPDVALEDAPLIAAYGHPDTLKETAFQRPEDLTKIVSAVENPEIVSTGPDGTVVRATFKDPAKVYNLGSHAYTAASLLVLVAPNGEPKSVTLDASGPDGQVNATADHIVWNGRVKIPAPKKSDFVDEGAVSKFGTTTPLHQPTAIPKGWRLDQARVLPAELTNEGCTQADLAYADPRSDQASYAEIFEFPTSCANPNAVNGGQPFTLGGYQGTIAELPRGGIAAQFDVNGTTVQVVTSVDRVQFERVFGKLATLDFANPPKANLPGTVVAAN